MLACNIADSFAKYRWCPNIIGPQSGGAVKDLPVHLFETMGQIQAKIPTEVLVTDRREFELAEEGFITLPCVKTLIMQPFSLQTRYKNRSTFGKRCRNQL